MRKYGLGLAAGVIGLLLAGCSSASPTVESMKDAASDSALSSGMKVAETLDVHVNDAQEHEAAARTEEENHSGESNSNPSDEGPAIASAVTDTSYDNVIDQSYGVDEHFELSASTMEMNQFAQQYSQAWGEEWQNVISQLRTLMDFEEDRDALDRLEQNYEAFVEQAAVLEKLSFTDIEEQPANRSYGTLATSASLLRKAELIREQTLELIRLYEEYQGSENSYVYVFSEYDKVNTEEAK